MTQKLPRGGYSQEAPEGIHQHHYMGGGCGGCGGYVEALEIETIEGPMFVLQEHRSDVRGQFYRWQFAEDGGALEELWKFAYTMCITGRGMSEWFDYPVWESPDYLTRQKIVTG